jgi:hypothetical protein
MFYARPSRRSDGVVSQALGCAQLSGSALGTGVDILGHCPATLAMANENAAHAPRVEGLFRIQTAEFLLEQVETA